MNDRPTSSTRIGTPPPWASSVQEHVRGKLREYTKAQDGALVADILDEARRRLHDDAVLSARAKTSARVIQEARRDAKAQWRDLDDDRLISAVALVVAEKIPLPDSDDRIPARRRVRLGQTFDLAPHEVVQVVDPSHRALWTINGGDHGVRGVRIG